MSSKSADELGNYVRRTKKEVWAVVFFFLQSVDLTISLRLCDTDSFLISLQIDYPIPQSPFLMHSCSSNIGLTLLMAIVINVVFHLKIKMLRILP